MKNDLTQFEKDLLRVINTVNGKKFTYKNLMEWRATEKEIRDGLREGEICYSVLGVFVAIKPDVK